MRREDGPTLLGLYDDVYVVGGYCYIPYRYLEQYASDAIAKYQLLSVRSVRRMGIAVWLRIGGARLS